MRKILSLAAAAAAALAVTGAQATVIVVDTFDIPVGPTTVFDAVGGNGLATQYGPDGRRIIRTELLTSIGAANSAGLYSSVTFGGGSFPPGTLTMTNQTDVTTTNTLIYNVSAGLVPSSGVVSLYLDVYSSDAVTKNITLTIAGVSDVFTVGGITAPGSTVAFGLSAAQQAALVGGGEVDIKFEGALGWDMTLAEVGFKTPEPTTLALVGMGLLGAGFAARRRAKA